MRVVYQNKILELRLMIYASTASDGIFLLAHCWVRNVKRKLVYKVSFPLKMFVSQKGILIQDGFENSSSFCTHLYAWKNCKCFYNYVTSN